LETDRSDRGEEGSFELELSFNVDAAITPVEGDTLDPDVFFRENQDGTQGPSGAPQDVIHRENADRQIVGDGIFDVDMEDVMELPTQLHVQTSEFLPQSNVEGTDRSFARQDSHNLVELTNNDGKNNEERDSLQTNSHINYDDEQPVTTTTMKPTDYYHESFTPDTKTHSNIAEVDIHETYYSPEPDSNDNGANDDNEAEFADATFFGFGDDGDDDEFIMEVEGASQL
jgi:hypothetical protein